MILSVLASSQNFVGALAEELGQLGNLGDDLAELSTRRKRTVSGDGRVYDVQRRIEAGFSCLQLVILTADLYPALSHLDGR